ncbi:MAG: ABC transporter ATP-binding protein/permease [Clostridia bacterium]|nr:ABC transporter ATP-binding protein/permease [Clostridia bacterium]
MLKLTNIVKEYPAGGDKVAALRGVSVEFRKNEFVAVLGPSGCGKTTLLNIIGGLDQYTDGDLSINGVSTKKYKDSDWDAYRNHSIGFVFQSYNLIPHQSVLNNVELALTISGVSKKERRARAVEALKKVGLGDQLKKRPNQMSGGQMQRVAIARALVNDPEILLADEPTGALDSETSVQVMDLLKEIAHDRLVIMVTHNPELADQYATRIVRLLDGKIIDDTAPYTAEAPAAEQPKTKKKTRKPSMSFFTALSLSLKNLLTKKGRTVLTSFAGSIGIIGIALIYAVSQGMTAYIDAVQEDTLSSYPLTIEATNVDLTTLMETFMGMASNTGDDHDKNAVYSQSVMFEMINAMNNLETTENDLVSFKEFIDKELSAEDGASKLQEALSGVQYTYDLSLLVYTKNVDGNIIYSDTRELLSKAMAENFGMDMSSMMGMGSMSSPLSSMASMSPGASSMNLWTEILSGKDGSLISPVVKNQYEIIDGGSWPTAANEIVLVVDKNNELDDLTLYALGLESEETINALFDAVLEGNELDIQQKSWSYEELREMEFRVILNSDCYTLDPKTNTYTDLRETEAGLRYLYDNALTLKVTGIVRPREEASSAMLTGSIGYTKALTELVIEKSKDSPAIQAQKNDAHTDIFTGLPFKETAGSLTDEEKEAEFRSYIQSLSEAGKAEAYVKIMSIPSEEYLTNAVAQAMANVTRETMETTLLNTLTEQMGVSKDEVSNYISSMSDEDLTELYKQMVTEGIKMQYAAGVQKQLASMDPAMQAAALELALPAYTTAQCALYYEEVLVFSESSYEANLIELGSLDLDDPATVNLYASSFENKDVIEEVIADYNENVEELSQIRYTDYVGIMMSSITTIINAITYVLIAFVAISLIVSSIMIGVITLISVQERTKEIGILRAIGASKRNVSGMFNAETMIIGFASGLIGVGVTYLLCIPINLILNFLTGIANLKAILPLPVAAILVAISVLLTLISGIIPSRSAAKKDPVVALRTE